MRGRILKIRPGHLANFSGGAGYMPFIIFLSAPIGFFWFLLATVIIAARTPYITGNTVRRSTPLPVPPPSPDGILDYASGPRRLALHELLGRLAPILIVFAIAAIVAAVWLTAQGNRGIKDHSVVSYKVCSVVLGGGPLVAAALAALFQLYLIAWVGPRWYHVLSAFLVFVLLLVGVVVCGSQLI